MVKTTEGIVRYQPRQVGGWNISREDKDDLFLADTLISKRTQDKLGAYNEGGIRAFSLPEHFEIFDELHNLNEQGVDVRDPVNFIRDALRNSFPNTLSRAIYTAEGADRIIHGYGTKNPREERANLIGKDGNVIEVLTPEASMAFTGKSPEKVAELMRFINGTPAYVWRVNSVPRKDDERIVVLNAGSSGADIYAYRFPQDEDPALGGKI